MPGRPIVLPYSVDVMSHRSSRSSMYLLAAESIPSVIIADVDTMPWDCWCCCCCCFSSVDVSVLLVTLFDPEEILTYFVDDLTVISLIVTLCGVMRIMAVIIKADIKNYMYRYALISVVRNRAPLRVRFRCENDPRRSISKIRWIRPKKVKVPKGIYSFGGTPI